MRGRIRSNSGCNLLLPSRAGCVIIIQTAISLGARREAIVVLAQIEMAMDKHIATLDPKIPHKSGLRLGFAKLRRNELRAMEEHSPHSQALKGLGIRRA